VRNLEVSPPPGVGLADDDVLLVDTDRVAVHAATGQRFSVNVGEVAAGVVLQRGWVTPR
jgi:hypothetical protein